MIQLMHLIRRILLWLYVVPFIAIGVVAGYVVALAVIAWRAGVEGYYLAMGEDNEQS